MVFVPSLSILLVLLLSGSLVRSLEITSVKPSGDSVEVIWSSTDADPAYFLLRVQWIAGGLSAGVGNLATDLLLYNASFTPTIKTGDQFRIQAVPSGGSAGDGVYDSSEWLQALVDGTYGQFSPDGSIPSVSTITVGFKTSTVASTRSTSTHSNAAIVSHHSLSRGAEIGIIITGIIVLTSLIAVLCFFIWQRRMKKAENRRTASEKQVYGSSNLDNPKIKPELAGNTASEPFQKSELDASDSAQVHELTERGIIELQTYSKTHGNTRAMELESRHMAEMDADGLAELDGNDKER